MFTEPYHTVYRLAETYDVTVTLAYHALGLLFSALSHTAVLKPGESLCPSVEEDGAGDERGMFNAKRTLVLNDNKSQWLSASVLFTMLLTARA